MVKGLEFCGNGDLTQDDTILKAIKTQIILSRDKSFRNVDFCPNIWYNEK